MPAPTSPQPDAPPAQVAVDPPPAPARASWSPTAVAVGLLAASLVLAVGYTALLIATAGPAPAAPHPAAGRPGDPAAGPRGSLPFALDRDRAREAGHDDLRAVSAEGGPIEVAQMGLWLAAAAAAAGLAWRRRRAGDARNVLILLALGAVAVAAREADLHEALTPGSQRHPGPLGAWGVRYRGDWWVSTTAPVGPRVLWSAVGVAVAAGTVYVVRRGAPPLLRRDGYLRPLLPPLLAVGGMFFVAWGLDDLLRYRVPLRASQVAEETLELAAAIVYAGVVVWCGRLRRAG